MKKETDAKENILRAAARLFQIKGYNAVGLNEIIKESGSPKGSLYYYFPDGKEELAIEAVKLLSSRIQSKLQNELDQYQDPVDAIQYHISCIIEGRKEPRQGSFSIGLLALEAQQSSDLLRKACTDAFDSIKKIFEEKLVTSNIPGGIAKELSVVIFSSIEGAISVSSTQKNYRDLQIVRDRIGDLINPYMVNERKERQTTHNG
jgi:TetR/AcrR family transcriptional regulator, lmrAB and yxaGH operons repressor